MPGALSDNVEFPPVGILGVLQESVIPLGDPGENSVISCSPSGFLVGFIVSVEVSFYIAMAIVLRGGWAISVYSSWVGSWGVGLRSALFVGADTGGTS